MSTRRSVLATASVASIAAASSPWWTGKLLPSAHAQAPETCELVLENTGDTPLTAYVTGQDFETEEVMLLTADGTPYYIEEPPEEETPLPVDCAIPVESSTTITLPRMFGSRIYFVRDDTLEFFVNPGPALVEPSFSTPEDPNFNKTWSFCEFTFNDQQIYVNISYVDLVTSLPIGLTLEGDETKSVEPLPDGAVDDIAAALQSQAESDGLPWDQLVLTGEDGAVLRAMAPQSLGEDAFGDYWNSYVDQTWEKYAGTDLVVDIQGGRGEFTGRVEGEVLTFSDGSTFEKPNSSDIFTCDSGPFTNNPDDSEEKKGILARVAAAFNRSTILDFPDQPNGAAPEDFYQTEVTNHWARIVHENSPIGYAFPYDDVTGDDMPDQSGAAYDGNPQRLTVRAG